MLGGEERQTPGIPTPGSPTRSDWRSDARGTVEDGEKTEQAAVREVKEETGVDAVVVGHLGTDSY
ncbi:NUDIX domain-containing protein [Nesterenkonia ebinurensis]|uniref:NUDIX domain-containing protein n=1 Tax=Nesterenkonia ebinurensis TaxID=2608252 RepID=UPI00123D9C11|nr:NUDIX domain-containing protein [Nesterenkonia ebinurensis]